MPDAEKDAPFADGAAFVRALANAWDCCATCAGGVMARRDRERDARRDSQAESIINSLRARLDAVSDLADHLVGHEAAPLIREALNGYVPTRPLPPGGPDA